MVKSMLPGLDLRSLVIEGTLLLLGQYIMVFSIGVEDKLALKVLIKLADVGLWSNELFGLRWRPLHITEVLTAGSPLEGVFTDYTWAVLVELEG